MPRSQPAPQDADFSDPMCHQAVEDYEFSLQTAANIVAPPTFTGELVKLDKGPAMEKLKSKHFLRPFLLDVYRVDFNFG